MFKFIKRFLLAWKLARNPEALSTLWTEVKSREEALTIREAALKSAKSAIIELVPADRHAHRKDLDIVLNFQCAEVMSSEEADQILEESRIDDKPKLSQDVFVTQLGNQEALIKHNEKRHNDTFLE